MTGIRGTVANKNVCGEDDAMVGDEGREVSAQSKNIQ